MCNASASSVVKRVNGRTPMKTPPLLAPAMLFLQVVLPRTEAAQPRPTPGVPQSDLRLRLDAEAPHWLKEYDVPSVAIAYVENGKLAWTAVYGEQSPGVPATARTLYNIASLTKPISAELILRLASAGQLSLDEPVSAYWIDPDVKDNAWNQLLTPRLCLSHQTGFTNWRYQTNNVLHFQWEPGTRTGYSGEGYDYLGRFVEKKTGRGFEDLAKEYVFDPIGMSDTAYSARDWYAGRLAVPHGPKGESEPKTQSTWCAADLVRTTIGDYVKFLVSSMRNEGVTREIAAQRVTSTRNQITPAEQATLCARAGAEPTTCRLTSGMGLGWQVVKHNDETIVNHDGSDWGVHTLAFYIPQRTVGAVIFTNGEDGAKVIREVVGMLYPDPVFIATLD